jgi:hypothetical protein
MAQPTAVPRPAPGGRWLLGVPVLVAIGLLALSVIPRWIVHHRELTGEGYRTVLTELSAWHGPLLPAAIGVGLAVIGGAMAAARLAGYGRLPRGAVVVAELAALAVLAAFAWPVAYARNAVSLSLTPGWAAWLAIALAAVGAVAAGLAVRWGPRRLAIAIGLAALLAMGTVGGRTLGLRLATGTGEHHQEGSYSRVAIDGEPAETLTIEDGRYTIGSRWSGTFLVAGPLVSLVDDPACPGVRGTYHLYAAGGQDVQFVKVIDTCQDGARARVLETGTWARD